MLSASRGETPDHLTRALPLDPSQTPVIGYEPSLFEELYTYDGC